MNVMHVYQEILDLDFMVEFSDLPSFEGPG